MKTFISINSFLFLLLIHFNGFGNNEYFVFKKELNNKKKNDTLKYFYSSDTILQSVKVVFLNDTDIFYIIQNEYEKKGIHEKYSGFATNTNSKFLNSGIGVDDKGAATYPYYSFYNTNKKNNCYVIIEIEVNTKKKLTFFDGCDKSVLFNSPFKSIGILKLQ